MFIAKNNDLIILANDSREILEEQLQFMVYTSIEETEENYILYNGKYLTQEEYKEALKQDKIKEIDAKIEELEKESVNEILYNNSSNIQVYRDVINGLEDTKKSLLNSI